MDIAELHHHFLNSKGVSTDTRESVVDKIFFALKGGNFDGNKFAEKALKSGAKLAVVGAKKWQNKEDAFYVDDPLKTLQDLAAFHRKWLDLPVLAITGSNGKTTTKELVSEVLKQKYKVVHTQGNLNNHIGVPLTLLSMDKSTEIGVVEMGANHQKEIAQLCVIAQPNYGYITNFGKAHLEGFGGFEGVIKGKSELYDFLKKNHGKIFVNADDGIAVKQSAGGTLITFGEHEGVDVQITYKEGHPLAVVGYKGMDIKSQLMGSYNAKNMAAAIGIGRYFDVSIEDIKKAIQNYNPVNNRSQIIEKGTNKIILDAYNANPTSMVLALENFEVYQDDCKIVILGDMFEVGETALEEHQNIVDLLEKSNIDKAFVCGATFAETHTKSVHVFKTYEALKNAIAKEKPRSALVLIKGSRGMALERIVDEF